MALPEANDFFGWVAYILNEYGSMLLSGAWKIHGDRSDLHSHRLCDRLCGWALCRQSPPTARRIRCTGQW